MAKIIKYDNADFSDDITDLFLKKAAPNQGLVDYRMQLAAKIISAVRKKGWDNSTFAAKIGVKNLSIITKWFSGTNNFEGDTIYKIQNLLGISLLNLEQDVPNAPIEVNVFYTVKQSVPNKKLPIPFGNYQPVENYYSNKFETLPN